MYLKKSNALGLKNKPLIIEHSWTLKTHQIQIPALTRFGIVDGGGPDSHIQVKQEEKKWWILAQVAVVEWEEILSPAEIQMAPTFSVSGKLTWVLRVNSFLKLMLLQ